MTKQDILDAYPGCDYIEALINYVHEYEGGVPWDMPDELFENIPLVLPDGRVL